MVDGSWMKVWPSNGDGVKFVCACTEASATDMAKATKDFVIINFETAPEIYGCRASFIQTTTLANKKRRAENKRAVFALPCPNQFAVRIFIAKNLMMLHQVDRVDLQAAKRLLKLSGGFLF